MLVYWNWKYLQMYLFSSKFTIKTLLRMAYFEPPGFEIAISVHVSHENISFVIGHVIPWRNKSMNQCFTACINPKSHTQQLRKWMLAALHRCLYFQVHAGQSAVIKYSDLQCTMDVGQALKELPSLCFTFTANLEHYNSTSDPTCTCHPVWTEPTGN